MLTSSTFPIHTNLIPGSPFLPFSSSSFTLLVVFSQVFQAISITELIRSIFCLQICPLHKVSHIFNNFSLLLHVLPCCCLPLGKGRWPNFRSTAFIWKLTFSKEYPYPLPLELFVPKCFLSFEDVGLSVVIQQIVARERTTEGTTVPTICIFQVNTGLQYYQHFKSGSNGYLVLFCLDSVICNVANTSRAPVALKPFVSYRNIYNHVYQWKAKAVTSRFQFQHGQRNIPKPSFSVSVKNLKQKHLC